METSASPVVGIDVSKSKLDVVLRMNGKVKSKALRNSSEVFESLLVWLRMQKVDPQMVHFCMEATGVYSEPIALWLHDNGLKVSLVNPGCIKGFGQAENIRNKNDEVDAGLIARFCEAKPPAIWIPAPREQRLLRGWSDQVQALKDIRQEQKNRLEACTFSQQNELAESIQKHVSWIDRELAELEKRIDDHIDRHPDLKRDADLMTSIPGVGRVTAAKMLGQLGDMRRFRSAKALAAFIGVSPKQRTSGTSVRGRTTMSRIGSTSLRCALYMPGWVATRHNPLLKTFADRLLASGMAKKAVTGAVMRKLVHLIYAVIRSGRAFDPNYLQSGLAKQDGI